MAVALSCLVPHAKLEPAIVLRDDVVVLVPRGHAAIFHVEGRLPRRGGEQANQSLQPLDIELAEAGPLARLIQDRREVDQADPHLIVEGREVLHSLPDGRIRVVEVVLEPRVRIGRAVLERLQQQRLSHGPVGAGWC